MKNYVPEFATFLVEVGKSSDTELTDKERLAFIRQRLVAQSPDKIDEDGDECILVGKDGESVYLKKKSILSSFDE